MGVPLDLAVICNAVMNQEHGRRVHMRRRTDRSGFALVVVVLVTAVVVITVLATTSVVALGLRRGTSDEARSFRALLLAESAMNLVRATIDEADFPATTFSDDGGAPLSTFLTAAGTTAASGSSGGVTWSFAAPVGSTGTLSLEAIGTVGGAVACVLHDFSVDQFPDSLQVEAIAGTWRQR
jgi:Tfp pilus assembly protein PilX